MRQRHDHGVIDLVHGYVHVLMAQDCAVEGAVVDDDALGCVDERLEVALPRRPELCVPHVGGLVVYCYGHEQHLGLFGVAVRPVLDRHRAVGFEVKPKCGHQRFPCRISLTRPILMP